MSWVCVRASMSGFSETDGGHARDADAEQGKPFEAAVPQRERRSRIDPGQEGVLAPRAPAGLRRGRRPVGE